MDNALKPISIVGRSLLEVIFAAGLVTKIAAIARRPPWQAAESRCASFWYLALSPSIRAAS
jgi:hypothetical protein